MSTLQKSLAALESAVTQDNEEDLFKSMSYDEEREAVRTALNEKYKPKKDKMGYAMGGWVSDMYPGHCVAQVEIEKGKPKYYKIEYSIVDGKATLGEPIEVKRSWEPVAKSLAAEDGGFEDVFVDDSKIEKAYSEKKPKLPKGGGPLPTHPDTAPKPMGASVEERAADGGPFGAGKKDKKDKEIKKSYAETFQTEDGFKFDFEPPAEQEVRLAAPMTYEHDEIVDRIDRQDRFIPNISALKYGPVDE